MLLSDALLNPSVKCENFLSDPPIVRYIQIVHLNLATDTKAPELTAP